MREDFISKRVFVLKFRDLMVELGHLGIATWEDSMQQGSCSMQISAVAHMDTFHLTWHLYITDHSRIPCTFSENSLFLALVAHSISVFIILCKHLE